MATYKLLVLNNHLLDLLISTLDLEPETIKSYPNYQKLRSYSAMVA